MFDLSSLLSAFKQPAAPTMGNTAPAEPDSGGMDAMLKTIASGKAGTFDPQVMRRQYAEMFPDEPENESGIPQTKKDWGNFLMRAGINTMAASQKPFSTALGAVGEGAGKAFEDYDKKEQEKYLRKMRRRQEKMSIEDKLMQMAKQSGDNMFDREKFDFSKEMDNKRLGLQGTGLELEKMRNKMQQYDTTADAEGNAYIFDKLNPTAAPTQVMGPDGKPFRMPTKESFTDEIAKMVFEANLADGGSPDEAMKAVADLTQRLKAGAGGGKPKADSTAIQRLRDAVKSGNTKAKSDFEAVFGESADKYLQ